MTAFSSSFSLSDSDPVGGLVASALKPPLLDKDFQQIKRMLINLNPVIRDSFGVKRQDFRGQAFDLDPG